jgi:hypothetical protein
VRTQPNCSASPNTRPDYFLVAFGLPRRDVLADRSRSPTMGQALHMMNGEPVMSKVRNPDNILSELIARGLRDDEIVTTVDQSC